MKADFKRFLNLHTLQGKMFVIILAVALLVMALSLTLCCYLCVDAVEELTAGYMTNYIRFADETLSEKLDNAVMTSLTVTADQEIVHETIQSSAALASYRWLDAASTIGFKYSTPTPSDWKYGIESMIPRRSPP